MQDLDEKKPVLKIPLNSARQSNQRKQQIVTPSAEQQDLKVLANPAVTRKVADYKHGLLFKVVSPRQSNQYG